MTFKHDFSSSEMMRQFEKIALKKGLIQPEVIQKIASKQIDYSPSSNLTENVVKLCQGLRSQNMVKIAEELEHKFLNYKQAQAMYDTHNEKGEDVINEAHPKGSHKLDGVDSEEAVIEDILDQHIKTLKAVTKMPTGKLSSVSLINKVKLALGQTAPGDDIKALIASANHDLEKAFQLASKSGGLAWVTLSLVRSKMSVVQGLAKSALDDISVDTVNDAINEVGHISDLLQPNWAHNYLPEFINKGISTDALWNVMSPILNNAKSKLQTVATKLANLQVTQLDSSVPVASAEPVNNLLQQGLELIKRLTALSQKAYETKNQNAIKYISDETQEIYDTIKSGKVTDLASREKEVKQFEDWIASALKPRS
jgi:hypothetical protein